MTIPKFTKFLFFLLTPFLLFNCQIKSIEEAKTQTQNRFLETAKDSKVIKSASLLVHSDVMKLHWKESYGHVLEEGKEIPTSPDQPFHIASIGKIIVSVLVFQEIEKGKLTLETPISKVLGYEILDGLFVFEGIDYKDKVTIGQLLSHTSGIADYFESTEGETNTSVIHEITKNPDHFWTPLELIEFTRKNQKALSKPGDAFHYSDTGYVLLGILLEKHFGKNLEALFSDKIFNPLGMDDTYMYLRSEPKNPKKLPLSQMFLENTNVTEFKSVSADWAGGGLISTTEDLLKFHKALVSGKLVRPEIYQKMKGKNEFHDGIYYGYGLMTVKYGDMLFLMAGTPELYGHSGLLSTLMFYSPEYDAHIIANFGSTTDIDKSFEMMFRLMMILKDVKGLVK
ncbi:MAG: serine hydrolase domain-containing protein [Leptospira sp.]|nr:serine hydrolase domain-containing protein [Leptospira sp.]